MSNSKPVSRKIKNQGMNWIAPKKRLAIYLRDGLACVYCLASIEDGARLTLDHLVAYTAGGSNDASNLVTACSICNSSRGARSWRLFAGKVAAYVNHGRTKDLIVKHIENCRRRVLDTKLAAHLIAERGGFSAACKQNGELS